jgi:hypothetical protein
MRDWRKKQREERGRALLKVSQEDGIRRLQEILALAMPVPFEFQPGVDVDVVMGLAKCAATAGATSRPRQFAATIAVRVGD